MSKQIHENRACVANRDSQRLIFRFCRNLAGCAQLLALLALLFIACSRGSEDGNKGHNDRSAYLERELKAAGHVRPEHTIVLQLEDETEATTAGTLLEGGQHLVENRIPYEYKTSGWYRYCLDKQDPWIVGVRLFDETGEIVVEMSHGDDCVSTELPKGTYEMVVYHHAGSLIPPEDRTAFVHTGSPAQLPNFGAEGNNAVPIPRTVPTIPRGGKWAITTTSGILSLSSTLHPLRANYDYSDMDYSLDYLLTAGVAQSFGASELFTVQSGLMRPLSNPLMQLACRNSHMRFFANERESYRTWDSIAMTAQTETGCLNYIFYPDWSPYNDQPYHINHVTDFRIVDLGNYQFKLDAVGDMDTKRAKYLLPPIGVENHSLYFGDIPPTPNHDPNPELTFTVLYRIYDDASTLDLTEPQEGEVMLFGEAQYKGPVWVVANTNAAGITTVQLNSPLVPAANPYQRIHSIKVGPDVIVTLCDGDNLGGTCTEYRQAAPQITGGIKSLKITSARTHLISSVECVGCDLRGLNMTNLTLDTANLSQANLTGDDLTGTTFRGANLTEASLNQTIAPNVNFGQLPGIQQCCVSYVLFRSSCSKEICLPTLTPSTCQLYTGLCSARLAPGVPPTLTQLSRADFSDANLTGAQFGGTTISGAKFGSVKGIVFHPATIQNADFRGTSLSCADFSTTDLTTALFDNPPTITTDFSCRFAARFAKVNMQQFPTALWRFMDLTGAYLVGANGQNMVGTNLSGLDLRGAMLGGVHMDGVNLQNGLLNCDGSNCTDLTGAYFTGARLDGANLDHAIIKRADFDKCFLSNAILTNVLAQTDQNEPHTSFAYAYLYGANLDNGQFNYANFSNAAIYAAIPSKTVSAKGTIFNNADMSNAILARLDLSQAHLQDTHLSNATLVEANLSGGNCIGANFSGAFLQGVDLTGALLNGANLVNANVLLDKDAMGNVTAYDPTGKKITNLIAFHVTKIPPITIQVGAATVTDQNTHCVDGTSGAVTGCSTKALWTKTSGVAYPDCVPQPPDYLCEAPSN